MDVTVYTFEDADGNSQDWHTQDAKEAERYARQYKLRLIANTFEWADSEVVEDFTPRRKRAKP